MQTPTGAHLAPLLAELSSRLWDRGEFVAMDKPQVIVLVEALKSMGFDATMSACNMELISNNPGYSSNLCLYGIELESGALFSRRLFANWDEVIRAYLEQVYACDTTQVPGWKPASPVQIAVDPLMIIQLPPLEMKQVLDILPTARELIFDISGSHLDNNTKPALGVSKRATL